MRRRWLLLVVGAAALLGVVESALVICWLTTPPPAVTWENFRRLRKGMSERDVVGLLGESEQPDVKEGRWTGRLWNGENVTISLGFEEGVLDSGSAFPLQPLGQGFIKGPVEKIRPAEESFLDRIHRWLLW